MKALTSETAKKMKLATPTEAKSSPAGEKSRQQTFGFRESEEVQAISIGLQKLCQDKGVSLLNLAERAGIALKRLQAIYLGRWTPSPQDREAIAQALDTPSDDIAWEHNTPVEHFYGPG